MSDLPVPIAVVGMACRFPGGANSPEELWKMLSEGRDAWSDVPDDRFKWKSFYHPDQDAQGAQNSRGGHFIDQDIAGFDAGFFGIPPFECEAIDPQQRVQLEVAYEALENSGIRMDELEGSKTSVFAATFSQDYGGIQYRDFEDLPKYLMSGIGNAITTNRISHYFDLKGPSVTLESGCSGSMVSLHQACQSLRSGESTMALAGGVNLILTPDVMIPMSLLHVLDDDGKSYAFDSKATGYGRGEGAAMLVLKRLDDALRNGDCIRGIIRNTGCGQDGRTPGIMLPSRDAQADLIRSVYQQAGLDPSDCTYVESHGTGTAVGDAEEMSAIHSAFRTGESDPRPLYVGSIKPNIGHLECVSGMAGFIKSILMLEHDMIPPHIHLDTLKETVVLEGSRVNISKELKPWGEEALRRVSVNSFGYGGTNAHAILESTSQGKRGLGYSETTNGANGVHTNGNSNGVLKAPQVLVLTAKSEKSLTKALANMRTWISNHLTTGESISDLAHTLVSRRSILSWRYSLTASSLQDALSTLDSKSVKPSRALNNNQTVYVFTGQGAQWFAMGRELMSINSPYRDSLDRSASILKELGASWSLLSELSKEKLESRVNEGAVGQPATTAVQIALVDLLNAIGIKPDVVLGHSSGEIAAAYAAGALTQESAIKIAFYRGQIKASESSTKGAMLAVGLGDHEASQYISKLKMGLVTVACSNSPSSSTVSGDESAINELQEMLTEAKIFARRLLVDTAYHSHHVRPFAESYLKNMNGIETSTTNASIKFISSVIGKEKTSDFGPEYWVENLISKVRFHDAIESVYSGQKSESALVSSKRVFIEVGPHNALAGPVRQIVSRISPPSGFSCFPTLIRDGDATLSILDLAGKLFVQGCDVNLAVSNRLISPLATHKVLSDLPSYSWDHSTPHWHESRLSRAHRFRPFPQHVLLGILLGTSTSLHPTWRHLLNVDRLPWLRDHVINDAIIFPGSGYVAMAIEAIRQSILTENKAANITKYTLKNISFKAPLIIPEPPDLIEVQLSLTPEKGASSWNEFRVVSVTADESTIEHCTGSISAELGAVLDEIEASREDDFITAQRNQQYNELRSKCSEVIDCSSWYEELLSKGNAYGNTFSNVKELNLDEDDSLVGVVEIPNVADIMPANFQQPHIIHPSTLDSLMHASLRLFDKKSSGQPFMIVGIRNIVVSSDLTSSPGAALSLFSTMTEESFFTTDTAVFQNGQNDSQDLTLRIEGVEYRATGTSGKKSLGGNSNRDMSHIMDWGLDVNYFDNSLFQPIEDPATYSEISRKQAQKLDLLNQATAFYIRAGLDNLSAKNSPKLTGIYEYFFKWMQGFMHSSEYSNWISGVRESEVQALLDRAHNLGIEGELLRRIGVNLMSILKGEIDALALLVEGDLLYRLYADDSGNRCYVHVNSYVKKLAWKNPAIKILEVGGGSASCTLSLLDALSSDGTLPISSYDFTDISTGFFDRARTKLAQWDNYIQYKKLDLEINPLDQGFEAESYDLIVASNCVHCAASINGALTRIRGLLKPGGSLVMIETTNVIPFYNMTVGVLPGWWIGIDDGRINGPSITKDLWDVALRKTGFTGLDLSADDFEGPAQRTAVMVSKATTPKNPPKGSVKILECPDWEDSALLSKLTSDFEKNDILVSKEVLGTSTILTDDVYLVLDNGQKPLLSTLTQPLFEQIVKLVLNPKRKLMWLSAQTDDDYSKNPEKGMITGFARVARAENESLKFVTIDVQESAKNIDAIVAKITTAFIASFVKHAAEQSDEPEYLLRDGQLLIPRLLLDKKVNQLVQSTFDKIHIEEQPFHQKDRPLKLSVENPGFLDSIRFIDDDLDAKPLADTDVEVQVEACGVNFKDVLIALGQVKKPLPMAGEYSGRISKVGSLSDFKIGDRVFGFGGTAYASNVRVNGESVCHLPDYMSFVTGASIPVVFGTAYHALVNVARLQKGQSVLIHSATGGVGQAAVKIAQNVGATIFATVGSTSKRQFLMEQFGIPEDHIFSSKKRSFKTGIHRLTNGKGVDAVLNSLSGEALQESWASIAAFGTFIELGKVDAFSRSALSMEPFERNVTFASIDLQMMYTYQPATIGKIFADVMSMFEVGKYTPINPTTPMPLTEIEDAFRLIQGRKHLGKLVLEAKPETLVQVAAKPSYSSYLDSKSTYLIAGGLGGLGIEVAKYMVLHGARYIGLLSRRSLSPEQSEEIKAEFRDLGAELRILTCDIVDISSLSTSISTGTQDMPPIKGVIQAAMVLRDIVLAKMDLADFNAASVPKTVGTHNLLEVLKDVSLDFFVMLSSTASLTGNLSQANYAAGNAYMDMLATNGVGHKSAHLVSLNLGPIEDAGTLSQYPEGRHVLVRQGYVLIKLQELLTVIGYCMSQARDDNCKQVTLGLDYSSFAEKENKYSMKSPMFSHLWLSADALKVKKGRSGVAESFESAIFAGKTVEDAQVIISKAIAQKIAALVAIDYEEVDLQRPVKDFGLDSLVVIELTNWIAQKFQSTLQTAEIHAESVLKLGDVVTKRSAFVKAHFGSVEV